MGGMKRQEQKPLVCLKESPAMRKHCARITQRYPSWPRSPEKKTCSWVSCVTLSRRLQPLGHRLVPPVRSADLLPVCFCSGFYGKFICLQRLWFHGALWTEASGHRPHFPDHPPNTSFPALCPHASCHSAAPWGHSYSLTCWAFSHLWETLYCFLSGVSLLISVCPNSTYD